jgi:uncharacterized alpha-E superfamily protein
MLLSRVADSLYWIGRYLERAEHRIRLVDVRLDLGLDRAPEGWNFQALYAGLGLELSGRGPDHPASLVQTLVLDLASPGSVAACVIAARENARQVREEISTDMWQQLNELFLRLKQASAASSARPHYLRRLVIDGIHLFQGVTDATLPHGEGWHYLQAGRFIERATTTAALLDRHFRFGIPGTGVTQPDTAEWVGLLRCCGALEAYCRCYTADVQPGRIAEFLLLNAEFPRSVRFAAGQVEAALRALAAAAYQTPRPPERLAGRLNASLSYGSIDEILQDPGEYLQGIVRQCGLVHAALYQTYISYRIETALPA